jgi:hypothetical protein
VVQLDAFLCYAARTTARTPRFVVQRSVQLVDAFQSLLADDRLLATTARSLTGPSAALMCYLAVPARGEPRYPVRPEQLDAFREEQLCAPSTVGAASALAE